MKRNQAGGVSNIGAGPLLKSNGGEKIQSRDELWWTSSSWLIKMNRSTYVPVRLTHDGKQAGALIKLGATLLLWACMRWVWKEQDPVAKYGRVVLNSRSIIWLWKLFTIYSFLERGFLMTQTLLLFVKKNNCFSPSRYLSFITRYPDA